MPLIRYLTKHRMQLKLQKKTKKRTNLGTATIRIVYTLRILGVYGVSDVAAVSSILCWKLTPSMDR